MNRSFKFLKNVGPAAIITGAFIGPGTLTTTMQAGRLYGHALLWAVVFSGIASLVLMNMNTRLAVAHQQSILDAIRTQFRSHPRVRRLFLVALGLVALLSGLGFEAGNLMGASVGFVGFSGLPQNLTVILLALSCSIALLYSTPKGVEWLMKIFVTLMGLLFVVTTFFVRPSLIEVARGLRPSVPEGAWLMTLALIGTTIIAINLIFHSLASVDRWTSKDQLSDAYLDTRVHLGLGLAITLALVILAAQLPFDSQAPLSPLLFAKVLEVTLGTFGAPLAAFGLFCAGVSSAIATPYMVGVIVERLVSVKPSPRLRKGVALSLLWLGTFFAYRQTSPVPFILAAQAFSGVMLPLIAFLIVSATSRKAMGLYRNSPFQQIMGWSVFGVLILLGARLVWNVMTTLL